MDKNSGKDRNDRFKMKMHSATSIFGLLPGCFIHLAEKPFPDFRRESDPRPPKKSGDKENQEYKQKDEEKDSGDYCGRDSYIGKAEKGRDQSDDEKYYCQSKHDVSPPLA